MAEIFSTDWMEKYKAKWNGDQVLVKQLSEVDFNSNVSFGLVDEDDPRCVLHIQHGILTSISPYSGEDLDWDLRAGSEFWIEVAKQPPSLMKLGLAYTSRKLKFNKGQYSSMVKDPSLSNAFMKSLALMSQIAA